MKTKVLLFFALLINTAVISNAHFGKVKNSFGKKEDKKIDGNVTIDGKPAEFETMGLYNAFSASYTTPQNLRLPKHNSYEASIL